MSSIKLESNASGTGIFTIASPNSNTNRTLTLPDVTGTFNTSGGVNEVPAGSASAPSIFFTGDSNTGMWSPAADTVAWATGGTERARITSNGDFLVGTTTNVAANAKIFAKGSGVGVAVGYGTGSSEYRHLYMNSGDGSLFFFNDTNYASLSPAGAWTNASDARLKTNIRDIKYGLTAVLAAQPRHFERVDVKGTYVGFVAQELQEVIPEVVSGDPEKQLSVDYGSLVAVAFKAIQELKAELDATKAEVAALKGQA